jgi:hypothetical protein
LESKDLGVYVRTHWLNEIKLADARVHSKFADSLKSCLRITATVPMKYRKNARVLIKQNKTWMYAHYCD